MKIRDTLTVQAAIYNDEISNATEKTEKFMGEKEATKKAKQVPSSASRAVGLSGGGPGSGRHPEGGRKLKDAVTQGKFKGGWKTGGRKESTYMGYHTSFYDHPKHGLLEIKHGGPFRENPVRVQHNGTTVSNVGHDATRAFLRDNYGIRYGSPKEH